MNTKKLFGTGVTAMLLVGLMAAMSIVSANEETTIDGKTASAYKVTLVAPDMTYDMGGIICPSEGVPEIIHIDGLGDILFEVVENIVLPTPIYFPNSVGVTVLTVNIWPTVIQTGIKQDGVLFSEYYRIGPYVRYGYGSQASLAVYGVWVWGGHTDTPNVYIERE